MRPHPRRSVRSSVAPDRSGRRPPPLTLASVVDLSLGGQDFPAIRLHELTNPTGGGNSGSICAHTRSGIRQPSSVTTRPITTSLVDFSNEVGLRYSGPGPCLSEYALNRRTLRWFTAPCRATAEAHRPTGRPLHLRCSTAPVSPTYIQTSSCVRGTRISNSFARSSRPREPAARAGGERPSTERTGSKAAVAESASADPTHPGRISQTPDRNSRTPRAMREFLGPTRLNLRILRPTIGASVGI
jgi:hypothetical protein